MRLEQKMKFIGYSAYDFVDKKTGERVVGCKVDLVSEEMRMGNGQYGLQLMQVNADYSLVESLSKLTPEKAYLFGIDYDLSGSYIKKRLVSFKAVA